MPSSLKQLTDEPIELTWNSFRVCRDVSPPPPDRVVYSRQPDHCIIFHIANADHLERRLEGGKWMRSPSYPGGLTFVPAQHAPEWLWDREVELLEIYLPPSHLEQVAIESFEKPPQQIELIDRFATRDPFLEQLALAFIAELNSGTLFNKLYVESLQNVLAVHLLRQHCTITVRNPNTPQDLPQAKLQRVIDYIQSHLEQEIELADLAKVASMSPHHFGKRFKQTTGMPPHRYVMKCRIEQARKLLSNPQLAIAEVGQQLGFYDQSHFTHTFRKHTMLTPRQYRDRL
ncbi:helix-turn-helix transcriptional regulator [Oscillatoria sp. FACHB-1407]|uniref:helix-turn-helix domain-containing protein n=1 Tax=Oscillatoria sp. FACHB-1407 TaxID=2692847 RepID=UPI00168925E3|nr:AraC family transcriptional regulator [Oscillatoria sp. FACHB-1407]MBD2463555.1 helix-turn-helix transcriptional regulator [Oscillatoria sp. FACHB-1407]